MVPLFQFPSSGFRRPFRAVVLALLAALPLAAQSPVVRQIRNSGPNATRVNVAILGDGYTAAQQEQFFTDAQRKLLVLVNNESFASCKDLMNGVAIFVPSKESGTDIAADNIAKDTYYDTGFSGLINARLLTVATAAGRIRAQTVLRENAPDYDISIMLVNTPIYGGAGGSPAVASLHTSSDEVLLHEIGHSFALLADEYVDEASATAYPPAEQINATQKTERAEIPWRDFLLDSTPIPTTAPSTDANYVGLWEGSYYRPTGFYRPIYDSKMRSLTRPFGPVNLHAFTAALHRLNLNSATAAPSSLVVSSPVARAAEGGPLSLAVAADGVGPLTYQWSLNGKFLSGRTNPVLDIAAVSTAQLGAYAVTVTNAAGATNSAAAGLSVRLAADRSGGALAYTAQISSQSVLRWTQAAWAVSEESSVAVLTVSRSGSLAGPLSVAYATAPGTATSPGDFTAQNGTLVWADGDGDAKAVVVPLVADNTAEGLEAFLVTLSSPSAGIIVESPSTRVTVADSGTRDPAFNAVFVNNGVTRIIPLSDGSMLIAGFFTLLQDGFGVMYNFGRIARLRADGTIDPVFKPGAGADNTIQALARQSDGKILIGGDFLNYDGTSRARIARLNADGTLDASFNPGSGADSSVFDLLVQPDGKILVGGSFTTFNGVAREYLVRLNADGSIDTSFNGPDFASTNGWWVRSLTQMADGRLIVTGNFYFPGAQWRAGVCRLTTAGSLDPTFDGPVQGATTTPTGNTLGEVRQAAVLADGRILICGSFGAFNQVARSGLARLTITGTLDHTFDPGTGGDLPVDAILVQTNGKILVGGRFMTFNGVPAGRIARLTADGAIDPSFAAGSGFNSPVNTLVAQPDGHVLAGINVGQLQGSALSRPLWRLLAAVVPPSRPTIPTKPNTLVASTIGRLINLSIRVDLTDSTDEFTLGFVIGGADTQGTKPLVVRAAGPSLAAFGLTNVLQDPRLEFYTATTKVGENDNWGGLEATRAVMAQVGAFPLSGPASRDAALSLPALAKGANSAKILGTGAGTVIAEIYDATPTADFTEATPRLVNVSVLKHIGAGLTAGFVIGGNSPRTVLVRAIGPTLGTDPFGVPGVVADPQLTLFAGTAQVGFNDNWGGSGALTAAFAQVAAFPLSGPLSRDAALLVTLQPGNYTAQVTGTGGSTGKALVEIYEVP